MKTFDARGKVAGEHRFLGLWTSTAYHGSPRDIPVLRRKVERVVQYFGLDPQSHDGKAVLNVLETYPRDELFQASVDDLIRIARSVVNLYERRTVRLLVRRDPYHRFYSLPRLRPARSLQHRSAAAHRADRARRFRGQKVESYVQISGLQPRPRARRRAHRPGATPQGRLRRHREAIAQAALTWTDRLRDVLAERKGEAAGCCSPPVTGAPFRWPTRKMWLPADALQDLADLEALRERAAAAAAPQPASPGRDESPSACI